MSAPNEKEWGIATIGGVYGSPERAEEIAAYREELLKPFEELANLVYVESSSSDALDAAAKIEALIAKAREP